MEHRGGKIKGRKQTGIGNKCHLNFTCDRNKFSFRLDQRCQDMEIETCDVSGPAGQSKAAQFRMVFRPRADSKARTDISCGGVEANKFS